MGSPVYAASTPATPQGFDPSQVQGPYGKFRKNALLKGALVLFLIVQALTAAYVSGYLNSLKMKSLTDIDAAYQHESTPLDNTMQVASAAQASIALLVIILFAVWTVRVSKNGWLLDAPKMSTTPPWSVAFYIVPVLCFWKPYNAMQEIRNASCGQRDTLKKALPLWWTCAIITLALGLLSGYLFTQVRDQSDYLSAGKLLFISSPLQVLLCYLTIVVISGITRAQNQKFSQWRP
ncbi:MAG: DUF4328 domain-containing protein [Akkermansiaceae bacterium]